MKKDVNKIFERTLLTYTFILFFIFILKIAGFNYFGLDINNPVVVAINKFATKFHLVTIISVLYFCFNVYMFISIICNNNCKKIKIISFIVSILYELLYYYFLKKYNITLIYDGLFLLIMVIIINYTLNNKQLSFKKLMKNYLVFTFINIIFQGISLLTRNITTSSYNNNFTLNFLLNFDYILLMLIYYKLHFTKGEYKIWDLNGVCSFSDLLTLLKKQLKTYQIKFSKTKKDHKNKTKKEKFEINLYLILFLLWNIFQVFVVLFIAKLSNGLPECLFILISFWMNKTVFGKAFHMKRARDCFIVSTLAYYVLVRICISIHISLLIPIILGILLSYFTSLIVKYNEFKLYRGMPEEDLLLHCKICNLNKYDTTLMVDYYCNRKSDVQLAMKNHYSVESIKKQKKKIREILIKK